MKIAIVGSRGYPVVYGGYETFVKELAERLVKLGAEVHVYCHKGLFSNHPATVNGIHLHYIQAPKAKSLGQLVNSFFSIIHATFSSADVILVVNLAAGPFGWIPKLRGKKMIINTDGLEWQRPKWRGLGSKYFYFGAWCATKFYDLIISDADAMRRVYLQEFARDSEVIAYGAPPWTEANPALLESFNLVPDEYYLIVGRLIPDNKADLIIQGYLQSGSAKKLVVVGDVMYKDRYASTLKALATKKLIFLGYVTHSETLMALYQHCFVYLHGHKYGGTNPAMLKAMANNCAILALDTVFNREMLSDDRFGRYFSEDVNSISSQMHELEQNKETVQTLKETVHLALTDKYNWDQVTKSYLSAFEKLLQ